MSSKPSNLRKILEQSYAPDELAWLDSQPTFRRAADEMATLTDFEKLCTVSEDLLLKRDLLAMSRGLVCDAYVTRVAHSVA